ncbi:scabin-related ADP-ribosyltransferase [Nonomuraea dietziae]|uniref:scabin-related ADP-ribosyltransferase n=1 Tax=Nonomuraea dietziae TaxID=65515 RepID=UPI00340BE757
MDTRSEEDVMGLQPPPELATLANIVFSWPLVDEVVLHQAGSRWISFAVTAARVSATAATHAARTVTRNDGEGVRAFDGDWQDTSDRSGDAIAAALLIGGALQLSAMIVLAMKVALLLVLLRVALNLARLAAASGPTAGASLAGVPAVVGGGRTASREIVRKQVDLLERSALRLFDRASALLRKPPAKVGAAAIPPGKRPPTPVRGPDNYLEAAADKSVDVKSITPYPIWRRDREPLYRASDRSPDTIFEQGLHPRDPSMTNLSDYVLKSRPSAFVGTSTRTDIDNAFPRGHVYEVDAPGGIDVQETLRGATHLSHEREIAFPGGVHRRYISGAWPRGAPRTPEHFIPNPHYDPYPGHPGVSSGGSP